MSTLRLSSAIARRPAGVFGPSTAEVVERCTALGLGVPPLNWAASSLVAADVRMIARVGAASRRALASQLPRLGER